MRDSRTRRRSRREWLQGALATAIGASSSGWLQAIADQTGASQPRRSCILLWMHGGPSQTDTFDLKPGVAGIAGDIGPIATAVPGMFIGEHLPKLARQTDRMALLRGMTSKEGDHTRATRYLQTGYPPVGVTDYPCIGASVAKELAPDDGVLPRFVSVAPYSFNLNGGAGAGFLGAKFAPLVVGARSSFREEPGEELTVEDIAAWSDRDRLRQRVSMLRQMHDDFGSLHPDSAADTLRANYEQAARMAQSNVARCFDLSEEPDSLRDAYGRNKFGQGCLLARRLVERGVPFVEVTHGGGPGVDINWDTHQNNFELVRKLCGILDAAWATLHSDLEARGLLDSTLIVWMGEFGRTPRVNPLGGRDHHPAAWTAALSGAGVRGGAIVGDTGKTGQRVEDRPIAVPDLLATVCAALGVNPHKENQSTDRRPIAIVDKVGEPIKEALA